MGNAILAAVRKRKPKRPPAPWMMHFARLKRKKDSGDMARANN